MVGHDFAPGYTVPAPTYDQGCLAAIATSLLQRDRMVGCRPDVGPHRLESARIDDVRLIMRSPSPALRRALSQHPERDRIDPKRAQHEHAAYATAIRAADVLVTVLPPAPDQPDACFTWDTLLALARPAGGATVLLVAARPGAASRRPEVASVLESARGIAPTAKVAEIREPGTLDGGDVITYGQRVAIGISARTNEAGARQLAAAVQRIGYQAFLCPVDGRLHLASAVTPIGPRRLIGTASGFASLDAAGPEVAPDDVERLVIPNDEVAGANVLAIGGRCFIARGYPSAVEALRNAGESVVEVELDEFLRADGGPTCLVAPVP
jgi:dimethylargininase